MGGRVGERPRGLRDVYVASEGEMYAVHETGFWAGNVDGCSLRVPARRGRILSVCKWKDRVWVGTREQGLCRLEGDELVSVKDNQAPERMDSRGSLLLLQGDKVAGTEDGERYQAWKADGLANLWSKQS